MTPDAEALVNTHIRLAYKIGHRWGDRLPHLRDEFISDATFALFRAARCFDPARAFLELWSEGEFACAVADAAGIGLTSSPPGPCSHSRK